MVLPLEVPKMASNPSNKLWPKMDLPPKLGKISKMELGGMKRWRWVFKHGLQWLLLAMAENGVGLHKDGFTSNTKWEESREGFVLSRRWKNEAWMVRFRALMVEVSEKRKKMRENDKDEGVVFRCTNEWGRKVRWDVLRFSNHGWALDLEK